MTIYLKCHISDDHITEIVEEIDHISEISEARDLEDWGDQIKQGLDLRDLWRPLEGVIFRDLWLNWTHFGSLTEDNPDFFKLIFRGCFGLHLASEAESDLTIGFFMASNSSLPTFRC